MTLRGGGSRKKSSGFDGLVRRDRDELGSRTGSIVSARMLLLRFQVLLLVAAVFATAAGCAARGPYALQCMTPDQREFVAHGLTSFTPQTTPDDLDASFGAPIQATAERRLWHRSGSEPDERIEAIFEDGQLVGLRVFEMAARRPGCTPHRGWTWDLVARDGRLVPTVGSRPGAL